MRKLISGPRVFICNECVVRCREIIGTRPPPRDDPPDRSGRTIIDLPAQPMLDAEDVTAETRPPDGQHCSFCGKPRTEVARLVTGPTL